MRSLINRIAHAVLPPETYGAFRQRANPNVGRAWGGPFNGQAKRCLLLAELVEKVDPVAMIETGTYLGTTTEWISAFQLPLYSCELSAENFGFAKARLRGASNVQLLHMDSRSALPSVLDGSLLTKLEKPILVYLDAHWNDDLPLAEELDIIFTKATRAVTLIDDFQVPDDPGYGFDDYGPNKALNIAYIADNIARHGLAAFYPRTPSSVESGAKRGCVVLAKDTTMGPILDSARLLRRRVER